MKWTNKNNAKNVEVKNTTQEVGVLTAMTSSHANEVGAKNVVRLLVEKNIHFVKSATQKLINHCWGNTTQRKLVQKYEKHESDKLVKITLIGKEIFQAIELYMAGLQKSVVQPKNTSVNFVKNKLYTGLIKIINIAGVLMTFGLCVLSAISNTIWNMGFIAPIIAKALNTPKKPNSVFVILLLKRGLIHNFINKLGFQLP